MSPGRSGRCEHRRRLHRRRVQVLLVFGDHRRALADTHSADGDNVYTLSPVEGFGNVKYEWASGDTYVGDAYLKACRDRGSFASANCSAQWSGSDSGR